MYVPENLKCIFDRDIIIMSKLKYDLKKKKRGTYSVLLRPSQCMHYDYMFIFTFEIIKTSDNSISIHRKY